MRVLVWTVVALDAPAGALPGDANLRFRVKGGAVSHGALFDIEPLALKSVFVAIDDKMLVLAGFHIRALSSPVERLTSEAFSAGIFVAGRVKRLGNCDVVRVETPHVSIPISVSVSALPISEKEKALFWPADV